MLAGHKANMERYMFGIIFMALGVLLMARNRRIWLDFKRGKVRGIAGPAMVILGILLLAGVLPMG